MSLSPFPFGAWIIFIFVDNNKFPGWSKLYCDKTFLYLDFFKLSSIINEVNDKIIENNLSEFLEWLKTKLIFDKLKTTLLLLSLD